MMGLTPADLAALVTIGSVITIALGHFYFVRFRVGQNTKRIAEIEIQQAALKAELHAFQIQCGERFATIGHVRDVEQRIVLGIDKLTKTIDRLSARIDRLIDREKQRASAAD